LIKATCVIGNPYVPSRVHVVGHHLTRLLSEAGAQVQTIDLVDAIKRVDTASAKARKEALSREIDLLLEPEIVAVISPIYRASYPGVVKALFDELPHESLMNKVALPIMVGSTDRHYLAPRYTWAPMFEELGAIVPSSVFLLDSFIDKESNSLAPEALAPLQRAVSIAITVAQALTDA
jgi:FMN reductase